MADPEVLARRTWHLLEPIHIVTYFSPEPLAALKAAGYRGFWMGYFAGRVAPLGPVGPEVVQATFYNFAWSRVTAAIPDAWEFAPPEAALEARLTGSVAALRRHLGDLADDATVAQAADLAMIAAEAARLPGCALTAANRALPTPEDPLARLWHAATILREHRGDGHNAALLAAGISGRQSHVLQALAKGTPAAIYMATRDYDEAEWAAEVAALTDRGLAADGALTDAGRALRAEVESRTDAFAATAYDALSPAQHAELITSLLPLATAVAAHDEIPMTLPDPS